MFSENSMVSSIDSVNFKLSGKDIQEVRSTLSDLTESEETLLNHLVHQTGMPGDFTTDQEISGRYRDVLETLLQTDLVLEDDNGSPIVPDAVKFLPEGPGTRRDQLSGVLHRLPLPAVREWYRILGGEDPETTEDWLVFRRLVTEIHRRREELNSYLPQNWTQTILQKDPSSLGLDDQVTVNNFFSYMEDSSPDFASHFLAGVLLPSWDEDGVIRSVILEFSFRLDSTDQKVSSVERSSGREVEWERKPFSPAEQLKFLLIAADAVPFRETREGEPHRFDLKEVARVSEWSIDHLEYLTFLLVENGFLETRDERFFMNQLAEDWDDGTVSLSPFLSCHGTTRITSVEDAPGTTSDLTAGRILETALRMIVEADGEVLADNGKETLRDHLNFRSLLMTLPEEGISPEKRLGDIAEGVLETLFEFGLTDRLEQDEMIFYRPNDRGKAVLESEELRGPEHEELPYILQPDGQLLVPLESPLRAFRRINPFALLVKADRMLGYQIDRQSLVQALNDGWDATSFRSFLERKTESVPEPLEDLFNETVGNVKEVEVRKVHHLIQFKDGATTAKAANILNNYDPIRIDENTLVLQSETSPETIRRNLSRGGIRLSGGNKDANMSPLLGTENQ